MKKLLLLLFFINSVFCQSFIKRVGLFYGWERSQRDRVVHSDLYEFSLDVKTGGDLYKSHFEWEISAGYFDDGILNFLWISNTRSFSYHGFNLSSSILFFPKKIAPGFLFPIHILSGFTLNIASRTGSDELSAPGIYNYPKDYLFLSFDLGLGLYHYISEKVRVRADFISRIPISENGLFGQDYFGFAFKSGLDICI